MLKQLLHLDSIDGIQNYDPILKTYHCYNTNILINKPIANIKEISLKSVEMPLFFNNIRTANNSNIFSFECTIYGNYTKISCDSISSYFNLYMSGLEPERYYKILIKTHLSSGEIIDIDNNLIFKIVK